MSHGLGSRAFDLLQTSCGDPKMELVEDQVVDGVALTRQKPASRSGSACQFVAYFARTLGVSKVGVNRDADEFTARPART